MLNDPTDAYGLVGGENDAQAGGGIRQVGGKVEILTDGAQQEALLKLAQFGVVGCPAQMR